ncbi:MAG: hypothetical protein PHY16_10745 [Methylobacter sp.]|nr:hypothetical protein [Methylobacter sp.]
MDASDRTVDQDVLQIGVLATATRQVPSNTLFAPPRKAIEHGVPFAQCGRH